MGLPGSAETGVGDRQAPQPPNFRGPHPSGLSSAKKGPCGGRDPGEPHQPLFGALSTQPVHPAAPEWPHTSPGLVAKERAVSGRTPSLPRGSWSPSSASASQGCAPWSLRLAQERPGGSEPLLQRAPLPSPGPTEAPGCGHGWAGGGLSSGARLRAQGANVHHACSKHVLTPAARRAEGRVDVTPRPHRQGRVCVCGGGGK